MNRNTRTEEEIKGMKFDIMKRVLELEDEELISSIWNVVESQDFSEMTDYIKDWLDEDTL